MQKAESQSESFSPLSPPLLLSLPPCCRINVQESKANTLKLCTDSNGNNNELPPRPLETLRLLRAPAFTHPLSLPLSLSPLVATPTTHSTMKSKWMMGEMKMEFLMSWRSQQRPNELRKQWRVAYVGVYCSQRGVATCRPGWTN